VSPPTAEPTGGTRTFRADVRLIAASNRDLSEAVAAEILGLKRTTLEARMKKLGIRRQALEFSIHFFGWPQEKWLRDSGRHPVSVCSVEPLRLGESSTALEKDLRPL